MYATPVRVTLPVFADQYAETDAGAFVASIAELMESDHLGFDVALCPKPEVSTPRRRRRSQLPAPPAMISQTWMFCSRQKSPRARHRCGLERFY
jgi:hypothetical protein